MRHKGLWRTRPATDIWIGPAIEDMWLCRNRGHKRLECRKEREPEGERKRRTIPYEENRFESVSEK